MIVCLCKAVSDRAIATTIAEGARTPEEIAARCRAGTGCGACVPTLQRLCDRACEADVEHACHASASKAA